MLQNVLLTKDCGSWAGFQMPYERNLYPPCILLSFWLAFDHHKARTNIKTCTDTRTHGHRHIRHLPDGATESLCK